jgi:diaminopimelate epimerase
VGRSLPFAKFHGAGNDFVVVDGRAAGGRHHAEPALATDWPALARRLCDRHFGVGADGLLVAAPPSGAGAAQRMRMFNPDGSEAEMCGNGLRCFVRWLVERGEVPPGTTLAVETGAGVLAVEAGLDGRIAAQMGPPMLRPAEIPLAPRAAEGQPGDGPVLRLPLRVPQGEFEATCVSMGNPHAVVFVPDVAGIALEAVGPALERHPAFPQRTNVEFCQVLSQDRLRVRVWERGAGITLACGTGACATVVAARLRGAVGPRVTVELPGGELEVAWPGAPGAPGMPAEAGRLDGRRSLPPVVLRGPVVHVFDGAWLDPVPHHVPGSGWGADGSLAGRPAPGRTRSVVS